MASESGTYWNGGNTKIQWKALWLCEYSYVNYKRYKILTTFGFFVSVKIFPSTTGKAVKVFQGRDYIMIYKILYGGLTLILMFVLYSGLEKMNNFCDW